MATVVVEIKVVTDVWVNRGRHGYEVSLEIMPVKGRAELMETRACCAFLYRSKEACSFSFCLRGLFLCQRYPSELYPVV